MSEIVSCKLKTNYPSLQTRGSRGKLSLDMIRKINKHMHISTEVLVQEY